MGPRHGFPQIRDTSGGVCYYFHMARRGAEPEGNETVKNTYTAKTADGREFTRTSARTYTHASVVTMPSGATYVKFSSSRDLAEKAAASHFSVPQAYRSNPRAHAEETARMKALIDSATIEIIEVTA